MRDPDDAHDACQATFLVLVHRAGSVRRPDSVASWLYGVALRVASDLRDARSRRRRHEAQYAAAMPRLEGADAPGPNFDAAAVLHEELGRLPERYRAPLVLCGLEGLTCDEAARRLNWPVGTVKSRLSRGRDRLKGRLTRRGLAPAVAVGALAADAVELKAASLLPAGFVRATARAAVSLIHDGRAAVAAGTVPEPVAALVKGFSKGVIMTRIQAVAAVAVLGGGIVVGAGVLRLRASGPPLLPMPAAMAPSSPEPKAPPAESKVARADPQDPKASPSQAKANQPSTPIKKQDGALKEKLQRTEELAEFEDEVLQMRLQRAEKLAEMFGEAEAAETFGAMQAELVGGEMQVLVKFLTEHNYGLPIDLKREPNEEDQRLAKTCEEARKRLDVLREEAMKTAATAASGKLLKEILEQELAARSSQEPATPELEPRLQTVEKKLDRLIKALEEKDKGTKPTP